ncbi:unnamed protein product [Spirodela intermedia]|uniref:Small-subunit processome Utp12 domain-containing protein n=1 Tax=Spirodela intermedia TaxID=51605 RepID=A0A7I8IM84_SPIIN|nr:unnamed protein product [Spirodela intermedia]CAA6658869.1 unnamed protein product [Spirodela intermedia]
MASPNIKDLLTAFSPRSEFFAISSGDGRIKIWDTLKGHLQTEFSNILSTDTTAGLQPKLNERGHLSLDYKCMQWVQLANKKKRKSGNLLLVLGTGTGDALALDISSGTLKWKVTNCHPGTGCKFGLFLKTWLCLHGGVDGIVCQIDSSSGNILGKFKASTKAVSSLSVSADGRLLATAASQLKVFNCSDNKKIQKFSGHPVGVRCMIFSEDGKYILSSGVGERFSAACVLSMEHPSVFLTSKVIEADNKDEAGFCVLTLSEIGLCYFWHGKTPEDLKNSRPAKISLSIERSIPKNHHDICSAIYSAKLQGIASPASVIVLFAYGSVVKPLFEKLSLEAGTDINLTTRLDGVLLPIGHSYSSQRSTSLDRANAEDATMPIAKLYDSHNKKRKNLKTDPPEFSEHAMDHLAVDIKDEARHKVSTESLEDDSVTLCLEDRLKSAGILCDGDVLSSYKPKIMSSLTPAASNEPHILVGMDLPAKKVKSIILSMSPTDALNFLDALMIMWKTGLSVSESLVLPWILCILVNHGHFIVSRVSSVHMLSTLHKMSASKSAAVRSLLQLSGRLQLFTTQAGGNTNQEPVLDTADESEVEDDGVDDVIYGEEDSTRESGT